MAEPLRPDTQRTSGRTSLWLVSLHLACCGGAALLLLLGGAGIAGAAVVRASFGLLLAGLAVVALALVWRTRGSSRGKAEPGRS